MTNQRAGANDLSTSEVKSIYENGRTLDWSDRVMQIKSMALVGASSTDSELNLDLSKEGYRGVFEVIVRLCDELYSECEDLELATKPKNS